jgi:DNA-directed RNA polymerase sigma subunit (sigma70/sigma32)
MRFEAAYLSELVACPANGKRRDVTEHVVDLCLATEASEKPLAAVPETGGCSDEQLLEQVRNGAKEAITHLFRRHARAVHRVALRILRDHAEAEDLVQEVFLFIFRKAALYDPARGAGASWIIQIVAS